MKARMDSNPSSDGSWILESREFDPAREREMEALYALGNGYVGTRGSLDLPLPSSQADLYVAGVFARKADDLPYSELQFLAPEGRDLPFVEIVPLPFPFRLSMRFQGASIRPGTVAV